jgi:SAM-dependent methyltransferase
VAAELDTREDREGVHDRSGSRLARALRFVRKQGPGEVWRLAREHGWSGSAHFVYRNLRYMLAVWRGRAFDRANGVDTSGDVPAAFLDTTSDNRGLGHQFVPTSVRSFNYIMELLPRDVSGFSFVDVGSGKGRTLLLAARYPFRRIIGIEYAGSLAQVAVANVASYRGPPLRCTEIESVCADATAVAYPRTPLVLYFFNPFEIEIFDKVFARILESYREAPRPILLIYASGMEDVLERVSATVLGSGLFETRHDRKLPFYVDTPWRLSCRVFASCEAPRL